MNPIKYIKGLGRKAVDRLQYTPISGGKYLGSNNCEWFTATELLMNTTNPICFSGGAGFDISFELDYIKNYNGIVHLFDPSPTGIKTCAKYSSLNKFHFHPKALASQEKDSISLSKPDNELEGSWKLEDVDPSNLDVFPATSLVTEIAKMGVKEVDCVKLDIEGGEYEVIHELLQSDIVVSQILVEVHHWLPSVNRSLTTELLRSLKRKGYQCFHKRRYDYSFVLNKFS